MSLEDWAKEPPVKDQARRGWLSRNPEAAEDLHLAFRAIAEGSAAMSFRTLHAKLVELHGYPCSDSAMRHYLREKYPDLWEMWHRG